MPISRTAGLLITAAATACAHADPVDPQHNLRITFNVTPPLSLAPDMLLLNLGTVTVTAPFTDSTASLYNSGTLLGTATNPGFASLQGGVNMNPANCWRDPASPWTLYAPASMDFTSVRDGSIQGRIDWRPASGSANVDLAQVTLRLGQAASASSWFIVTPSPVIASIQIVPVSTCAADYDHNGIISPADVAVFVQVWLQSISQGTLGGDFDGNGIVEPADVALFVSRWFDALVHGCTP